MKQNTATQAAQTAAAISGIVIPTTAQDTLIAQVSAQFEAPIPLRRGSEGNSRKHLPCIGIAVRYDAREVKSTKYGKLGEDATIVKAFVVGYDIELDAEGKPIKDGEGYKLVSDEAGKPLLKDLMVGALEYGPNYNVPRSKRTAEDQLRITAGEGFPFKENIYNDRATGKPKRGKDKPDWNAVTGLESKITFALRNHLSLQNEQLSKVVASIPLGSDSKALLKEQQAGNAVTAAALDAERDPFAPPV